MLKFNAQELTDYSRLEEALFVQRHINTKPWQLSINVLSCFPQGTVLIHNAQELTDYSRSEEDKLAALIQGIADSGATVVAAGSAIGEMAMHFLEKQGIMVLRCFSARNRQANLSTSHVRCCTVGWCAHRYDALLPWGSTVLLCFWPVRPPEILTPLSKTLHLAMHVIAVRAGASAGHLLSNAHAS